MSQLEKIAYVFQHSPLTVAAVVFMAAALVLVVVAAPAVRRGTNVIGLILTAFVLAVTSTALSTAARVVGLS